MKNIDIKKIFELIDKHNVTHFGGAPIVLNMITGAPETDRKKLKQKVMGTSPIEDIAANSQDSQDGVENDRYLIVGAGVAGLQAIATAKRMGAIVYATDVRMSSKEQVESLGGKFLTVEGAENLETSGGYAKEA